jgi:Flp pilus assembly protein TadD
MVGSAGSDMEARIAAALFIFQAAVQKADGDYDGALRSLAVARAQYPRDRVVLNRIARIQFLRRQYAAAVETLKAVDAVHMHHTRMLCYRGLSGMPAAEREEKLFRRFIADEASQPAVHEHESVALGEGK